MTEQHDNDVSTAFDILLEEIEHALDGLNQEGGEAFQKGDYDHAHELMEKGSQILAYRQRLNKLQKEWRNLFAPVGIRGAGREATSRLERGLRTREAAFRVPILRALMERGGSGSVTQVLDRVEALIGNKLNDYDRSPLPSTPTSTRWRNTAQWARNAMVKEGLLAADSPRGTWEITEQGEQWLAGQSK